jgi:hypothetical protein
MPKFKLTQSQLASLKRAAKANKRVTLTLSHKDLDPHGIELGIDTRILSDGKRHRVVVDAPTVARQGGILPLIPIIAGLVAASAATAGGVATAVKSAKESRLADKMSETTALKNEVLKKQLAASGSGLYLKKQGCGFHLKRQGSGFHLKRGSAIAMARTRKHKSKKRK